MQNGWNRPGRGRPSSCHHGMWKLVGAALMIAGMVLLFLCIPGWAWAALLGTALIVAGLVVMKMGWEGR